MTSLVFGAATPSIGERNGGLAQSNTSDDTLPTVLDGVNNCVCEDLWRMFCIKETKRQCVVQWQEAQPAK